MTAGSMSAKHRREQRIGVLVHEELVEVVVAELRARGRRRVRAHAPEEALLVGLGEVQQVERLAQAPRGVGALRLGVEPPEQLVRLRRSGLRCRIGAVRVDRLVEVLHRDRDA